MTKLKTFAGDKINVSEILKFVFGRVENIVVKGESAGYPTMFSKAFYLRVVNSLDCMVKSLKKYIDYYKSMTCIPQVICY